jgi:hypothetical protein
LRQRINEGNKERREEKKVKIRSKELRIKWTWVRNNKIN